MANPQLTGYITESLTSGISKPEVIKILLGVGWPQSEIDAAFLSLEKPSGSDSEPSGVTPDSGRAVYSGDGSGVNMYDLGIAHDPTEKVVETHSVQPVTVSSEAVIKEPIKEVPVETKPIESTPAVEHPVSNHSESNLKYFWIVGVIFGLVGIVGLAMWWFVGRGDAKTNVAPQTNEQISSELVASANRSGDGQVLRLSETPYVSQKGFEIVVPDGWTADESGAFGTLVTFSNPHVDVDSGNRYTANINIVAEPDQGASLDEYLASSRKILTETFSSYVELSENKTTVGEHEAVMLEAKYDMGAYSLHNTQLIVKANGQFFVITGTAFDTLWPTYMSVMNGSLLSFR